MPSTTANSSAQGVQELLDKLRDDGVAAGQAQAERLVSDARVQAMEILDLAKAEAESLLLEARKQAAEFEASGKSALRMASRDVILSVREACHDEFRNRLRQFVKHRLSDQKLLEQMILELTAKNRPSDSTRHVSILLPSSQVSAEDLQKEVRDVQPGSLAAFVLGLTAEVLREGLTFGVSDDSGEGVRIKLLDEDVQLELTDQTITSVLMRYLAPRYRAVMQQEV
jgi:V/A-type H+-transporting ATPase subunit E